MLYSVVIYKFDGNDMTVIATIDNLTSLAYAQELEDLYQGEFINAYIDGYCAGKWVNVVSPEQPADLKMEV